MLRDTAVFFAILIVLFLFGRKGQEPTVFETLQAQVRGTCK